MERYTLENLEQMTIKQLKTIARDFGIPRYSKWRLSTKADNIATIFAHPFNRNNRAQLPPRIYVPSSEAIRQQVARDAEQNDYTRQELDAMTTMKELKEIAKFKGVPRYTTYKKATRPQLVLAILSKQAEQRGDQAPVQVPEMLPSVQQLQMRLEESQRRIRDLESENQRLKLSLEQSEKLIQQGGADERIEQLKLQDDLERAVEVLKETLPQKKHLAKMMTEMRITPEMVRQMKYDQLVPLAKKLGVQNPTQVMLTGGSTVNKRITRIQNKMNLQRLQNIVIRRLQLLHSEETYANVAMMELISIRAQKFSNWLSNFPLDVQSHYLYPWFILPETLERILGEKIDTDDIATMVDIEQQEPVIVVTEDIETDILEEEKQPEPRVINRFTSNLALQNHLRKAQLATTEEERKEGIAGIVRTAEPRYLETLQHRKGIEKISYGQVHDILNQIEKTSPKPDITGTGVPTENVLQKLPLLEKNIAKCLGLL